jgi:hypothetical protein
MPRRCSSSRGNKRGREKIFFLTPAKFFLSEKRDMERRYLIDLCKGWCDACVIMTALFALKELFSQDYLGSLLITIAGCVFAIAPLAILYFYERIKNNE